MNAKNDIIFFDMTPYKETEGIRERCKAAYIEEQLQKRFPEDHFTVKYAAVNESGIYQRILLSDCRKGGFMQSEVKAGITAIYCRLSRDDGKDNESNSISNQKKMLTQKARELGLTNTKYYVDDGYTGTNFAGVR